MNPGQHHWELYKQLMDPENASNNDHRMLFLQKLMEMMRRRHGQGTPRQPQINPGRDTWSDTPGYGNMPSFQIPGMQNAPIEIPEPKPYNGPRNQQMMLERMLLDQRLNNNNVWRNWKQHQPKEM